MTGIRFRRVAWLAVLVIIAWLLWMTLRPSTEINIPGVRMGHPLSEINLQPFKYKVQVIRSRLLSDSPSARRSARTYLTVDLLGNIAAFVPLGVALAIATFPSRPAGRSVRRFRARWWLRILVAGFLLSLGIELIQLAIPSRATDVDDVILNTLGTAVGAILAWGVYRLTSNQ
jgi:glycopeptide antibiotics resistance protein